LEPFIRPLRGSLRAHEHPSVGVLSLRPAAHTLDLSENVVEHFAVGRRHRIDRDRTATLLDALRDLLRKRLETGPPALAVLRDVHAKVGVVVTESPLSRHPNQILDRDERAPSVTDHQAELGAVHRHLEIGVLAL
jgi:hypothetical protein